MNISLQRELNELKQERLKNEQQLERTRTILSEQLKGEMGNDIRDVINGRKTVDIPKKERLKFKLKTFFNKIFTKF